MVKKYILKPKEIRDPVYFNLNLNKRIHSLSSYNRDCVLNRIRKISRSVTYRSANRAPCYTLVGFLYSNLDRLSFIFVDDKWLRITNIAIVNPRTRLSFRFLEPDFYACLCGSVGIYPLGPSWCLTWWWFEISFFNPIAGPCRNNGVSYNSKNFRKYDVVCIISRTYYRCIILFKIFDV